MWNENTPNADYPQPEAGNLPGSVLTSYNYYILAQNLKTLQNTAGYDAVGEIPGNAPITENTNLLPTTLLSRSIASYTFLATFLNCSFASNVYTLTANTLNTSDAAKAPYTLPTQIQEGMEFVFKATNSNTSVATLGITGLQGTPLSILKPILTNNVLSYTTIVANDIVAGQIIKVIYNATANSGSPAFVLQKIEPATETNAGILPIATNAQALAGVNDTNAMTPLKVKNYFDSLGGINYNYNDFPLTTFNTITNLTFNAGKYLNSLNAIITAPAINKSISGSFVAGNNANGLFPSVSLTANSWLYCFRIRNTTSGDVDAGFDNNINATNIPSGYDSAKLVGVIRINASSQIGAFVAYRVGTTCQTFFNNFVISVLSGSGATRNISTGFNNSLILPMVQVTATATPGPISINFYNSNYTLNITNGLSRNGANIASGASVNGFSYTVQTNASGDFVINSTGTINTCEIFGFQFNL